MTQPHHALVHVAQRGRSYRLTHLATWLLIYATTGPHAVHAQESQADAGVPAPRVVPYAASEIAGAVNSTTLSLEGLTVTLEPSPRVRAIEAALPALQGRVRGRANAPVTGLGLRELDEVRQTWLATQADLAHHQATLEERAASLEQLGRDLDDLRSRWVATRDVEPPLPLAALEEVRRVLREIAATRRVANERLAKALEVQRSVARVQLIATSYLA